MLLQFLEDYLLVMQIIKINSFYSLIYLFLHMNMKTIRLNSVLLLKMCPLRSQFCINCETTTFFQYIFSFIFKWKLILQISQRNTQLLIHLLSYLLQFTMQILTRYYFEQHKINYSCRHTFGIEETQKWNKN